jgi:hypothetical protein
MLVSEIATRVKRQFGDEANIQISDSDIIRWVNDAQREITVEQNLLQAKATASSVVGQVEYTIPTDTLTLRSVKFQGRKLQPMSLNEADEAIPDLDDTANYPSGTPSSFWVWANNISLYPKPDTVQTLEIYYTRQPAAVTATSDEPEVPLSYHNRIVEYCLAQAYELDENWQAAQAKSQQFERGLDKLKDTVDWVHRDYYPSITSTDDYGW